jgi:flagellar export protein FliJ
MKRFIFTLEPLLDMRKRKEDEVKRKLAGKNRQILKAKQEMQVLHDALNNLQVDEKKRRSIGIDLQSMRHAVVYRNKLKLDMIEKGNQIQGLYQESTSIQKDLTKAMQERRAIEILGEHRLAQWKKEAKHEEQRITDDVSQQGYIRKKREAAQAVTT